VPPGGWPGGAEGLLGGELGDLGTDVFELGELYWINGKPPSDPPGDSCVRLELGQCIAQGANNWAWRLNVGPTDERFQRLLRTRFLRGTVFLSQ